MLCLAIGKQRAVRRRLGETARSTDGVHNQIALHGRLGAVQLVPTQGRDDNLSLLVALVRNKPTRRLGKEVHGNGDDERKDDLEGNREAPGELSGTVGSAVVDPVRHARAEGDDTTLDADEQTAVGRARTLGLVGWDGGRVDTVTDSHDDTAHDKLGKGVGVNLGRDLDDDTTEHNQTARDDGTATSKEITAGQDAHGTEQTANLVDGCCETLHCRIVLGRGEEVVERRCRDDTAHDTGVAAR